MNTTALFKFRAALILNAASLAAYALLMAGGAGAAEAPKPAAAAVAAPKPAAAAPAAVVPAKPVQPVSITPQIAEYTGPTEIAPPLRLTAGKSTLLKLPTDTVRLSVGNPDITDIVLINPREIYMLGKKAGATNVFLWAKSGLTTILDVIVSMDTTTLRDILQQLMPGEKGVTVNALSDAVILSGRVSDPMKAQRLVSLAESFSAGKKVVNMLRVDGSHQVMLEVKVAEVSKTLLDKLGASVSLDRISGGTTYSLIGRFLTGAAGSAGISRGNDAISLDAEIKNGLVKILAEPTIMAISGQEGAFLAGGRIFIPVAQGQAGGVAVTLEEKEFGVGLKFTPTVLDDGRINLRVTPEVSELSQIGTPITTIGGQTNILPSITTRRASTTVQLRDGESFAIGGLIRNNVTQAVRALPILGQLPIIGMLFRSAEFQSDRSELLFIITPRLVKPLPPNYALPTDSFVPPTRGEFLIEGRMEGQGRPQQPAPAAPAQPTVPPASRPEVAPGGFELK